MNILVVNDDGIDAIGLQTLVKHLSQIGDVYVCAPESEKSGFGHHFTYIGDIKYELRQVAHAKKAYALWGTPADCSYYGIKFLFKDIKIDLVVSGINRGWNILFYAITSGTVAGAREAFNIGVPSLAVSLNSFESKEYDDAASIAKDLALLHLNNKDNDKYFLSINIPAIPKKDIKGIKVCTREGKVNYNETYYSKTIGDEQFIYSVDGQVEISMEIGTDTAALMDNYVTISPLYCDNVNHECDIQSIYIKEK